MADVKKGSDLITTMGETEKRMKKLERQMNVPRVINSVITASGTRTITTAPGLGYLTGGTSTVDRVTVVTTTNCLIYIMVRVDMTTGVNFGGAQVDLLDESAGLTYTIMNPGPASGVFQSMVTVPGTTAGGYLGGAILGGPLCLLSTSVDGIAAGKRNFSLQYGCNTNSDTITVKNRMLFAWVQPF